ncbi:hypothetical protein AB6A40_009278 [Gnathostoma spinigerum]|uniref:mRNA-decapping enzyme C-terminal domain-containing protein n=1 Tax=Gnathostoma spinigerum TaxID=75299 RepID=A0ABD6EWM8_9BILA
MSGVISTDEMNLLSVQRIDPCAVSVIDKSTHSALYTFDSAKAKWSKSDIEGPMLLYRRADRPYYSLMIANRQSLSDLIEPLTTKLEVFLKTPYIFINKPEAGVITGLWFYSHNDCIRVYHLIENLIPKSNTSPIPEMVTAETVDLDTLMNTTVEKNSQSQQLSSVDLNGKPKEFISSMPTMLQSLLNDESSNKVRPVIHPQGAFSADQLEQQLIHDTCATRKATSGELAIKEAADEAQLFTGSSSSRSNMLSSSALRRRSHKSLGNEFAKMSSSFPQLSLSPSVRREPSLSEESIAVTPLTREQILEAVTYLLKTDDDFVTRLHQAYIDSLNSRLRLRQ